MLKKNKSLLSSVLFFTLFPGGCIEMREKIQDWKGFGTS